MTRADPSFNGFVVQGARASWAGKEIRYRGPAVATSWPLEASDEAVAKDLTRAAKKWFPWDADGASSMWVSPSATFTAQYVRDCARLSLEASVLLCASEHGSPVLERSKAAEVVVRSARRLGWDYVTLSLGHSTVADDLFINVPTTLQQFVPLLNAAGLFDHARDLRRYVAARDEALRAGEDLEHDLDWVEAEIFAVDAALLLSLAIPS